MIKISALNEESAEESHSEEELTREALEQIALQQYSKALVLQRNGNLTDATQLLKDLLETELLDGIKKPESGEKTTGPLYNLKYLCYKNLGSMLSTANDVSGAIDAYNSATELDDTDVTLWYHLGLLGLRDKRYLLALNSFQRGIELNPRHWPCLDKTLTLLLGLDYKEECISTIFDVLDLEPGYLRALAYRRHIYTTFKHVKYFMEYINPRYKWNPENDKPIDENNAKIVMKEAEDINKIFIEQQRAEQVKQPLPILKLLKPITKLTWESVGDSLVHMHNHMSEHSFSHGCYIDMVYIKEEKEDPMEECEEVTDRDPLEIMAEENVDTDKNIENISENGNTDLSDKDKGVTDTENVDIDVEMIAAQEQEPAVETPPATTNQRQPKKKAPVRRRGSALSFLEQWEWCTKRRSGRKKPANRQERLDANIYDTLRRMVPICLAPDTIRKAEDKEESSVIIGEKGNVYVKVPEEEYFGTETEQKDVRQFINNYSRKKHDVIVIMKNYLSILAAKWQVKWPESSYKVFIEANKCYSNHIDYPSHKECNAATLSHYAVTNLLVEEFLTNEKLTSATDSKHDTHVIESIGLIFINKPKIFSNADMVPNMLRYLWLKLHIHILNKCEEVGLDCLHQLSQEFEAMGARRENFSLSLVNFTFKPIINEEEISSYVKFLERNKKLSTVMDLYDNEQFEEILSIIVDSFDHCKNVARQPEDEMSLDFAVQLSLILDSYWALDDVNNCIKWSFICLHEALTHYFHYTSGSQDYEKWNLSVSKIMCCMEHILCTEGITCLEMVPRKELSQGLEDLIRIIGHQVETNAAEMPFGTVIPWIILHFILQREEDQGRGKTAYDKDKIMCDEVPNPLMILFIAHEQLGSRGWCDKNEAKLLYFILDTVVPRLRSPYLSKSLEQVCQYMEQCVLCLFGHPGKKNKLKYLSDHNVKPHTLDWKRGQQLYEIFRPPILPALEGKISGITSDTEQLFHRILEQLPPECDPQKYVPEVDKYIKGIEDKLPSVPPLLPYRMKDIYFLLGDYYFKKEEGKMAIKYNTLDVTVNNGRLESWAEISLAKAVNLERLLNSCKNIDNEKDFLTPAKSTIRCFKRALELDPTHCNMWIEYGIFVYTVHSFCSRLLKQASESLSMEDFEYLEKQKEDMLDTTQKCFVAVIGDMNSSDSEKANEDSWLHYYMLGKVAEKRKKSPSIYLSYYMQAVKSLEETDATYPSKINYSSPTHLCIEVLELHYRIHSSILKYIEQHENKPIPVSIGKVFMKCIETWQKGPFMKKNNKDVTNDTETENNEPVHAANIFKRSISDAGEDVTSEAKKQKLESAAAKVRRSASYDTLNKEPQGQSSDQIAETAAEVVTSEEILETPGPSDVVLESVTEGVDKPTSEKKKDIDSHKKGEGNCSTSSSSSSSDSESSDTSSNISSESSRDSDTSDDSKPLSEESISKIVTVCLNALQDCCVRFPPHYKAIYRLAHYHFYYKKGKDIERCRDLMLSYFATSTGQKLGGLFCERKHTNFFNNIWKIPSNEVDRAGGFAFHMNCSVLLTMEILKDIDDHKTLLDLSLHLQRVPEPDKKYVRDSDREELAQQAFSLCVQSLKGQLFKFSQQADLKSNEVEQQALKSLMLDIYRAYQRVQKQPNSKQFTNLLIEGYKLVTTTALTENMNLVDLSMKYCQSLIQTLKQQATQASLDKTQNAQKKLTAKSTEAAKAPTPAPTPTSTQSKPETRPAASTSTAASTSGVPKTPTSDMSTFDTYLPKLNPQELTRQTAAALSIWNNLSNIAGYSPALQKSIQTTLQSSLQNSFQAEFFRQFIGKGLSPIVPPPKKQKRVTKPASTTRPTTSTYQTKLTTPSVPPTSKPSSIVTSAQKPVSASLAPSTGAVLPNLPASMAVNLASKPSSTVTNVQKPVSAPLAPSMGTVLPTLPASMANLTPGHGQVPARPSQAQVPAPPSQTPAPARPSQAQVPAPPSQTPAPARPSQAQLPAPPSQTPVPARPSQGQVPAPPSQTPVPARPSQAQVPARPSQAQVPARPSQAQVLARPSQAQVPARPSQVQVPARPSQAQVPARPTQSQVPARPTQSQVPARPSQAQVPARPSQAQVPVRPSQAQVPVRPSQTQVPAPPSQTQVTAAHSSQPKVPAQAHMACVSTMNTAIHTQPPMPHQQAMPGKTLQEKLAERQKNQAAMSNAATSSAATSSAATSNAGTSSAATSKSEKVVTDVPDKITFNIDKYTLTITKRRYTEPSPPGLDTPPPDNVEEPECISSDDDDVIVLDD